MDLSFLEEIIEDIEKAKRENEDNPEYKKALIFCTDTINFHIEKEIERMHDYFEKEEGNK